jgi:tetratricopeptide (TPR) repeat protein
MPPTHLCIFARQMSRIPDGAYRPRGVVTRGLVTIVVLGVVLLGLGCESLDGRNANRHGNRLFRDMQFIDAAASYEKALKTVEDPIIHYNLGLAYSKSYHAGSAKPVLLGEIGDPVCGLIPGTKEVEAQVCIKKMELRTDAKENVRRYPECDEKETCSSSYTCKKTKFCAAESKPLAELAAQHFQTWLKTQPPDDKLQKEEKEITAILEEARKKDNKSLIAEVEKKLDEVTLKGDVRKLMTNVWIDTEQFDKAIAYWESELAAKPNDTVVIGTICGIQLKAGDWRKSIACYKKVAELSTDVESKVQNLGFVGNIAWSKLNSKTLSPEDAVELADLGIGALQAAALLQPKLAKLWGLQASIYSFRGTAQSASYAQAIDRSSAEDLKKVARVLNEEAKKQQQGGAPATPTNPAPPATSPSAGGPAKTSGG